MFTNCNKCVINDLYEFPYNIFVELQDVNQLVIGMAMTEKEDESMKQINGMMMQYFEWYLEYN